jgi:hypothetical protein
MSVTFSQGTLLCSLIKPLYDRRIFTQISGLSKSTEGETPAHAGCDIVWKIGSRRRVERRAEHGATQDDHPY